MIDQWIETTGKLVFASKRVASAWRSARDATLLDDVTAVCSVCQLHSEPCLILNDEPLPTTLIHANGGVAFVRWVAADDGLEVISHALRTIEQNVWDGHTELFAAGDCVLFDAGVGPSSHSPYASLHIRLREGIHRVSYVREHSLSASEVILLTLRT
ncbi:hypothetical protein LBMAG48_23860 [Phycisphaerae bacterium]|nr:hypothetical protein LBMAG48_23860 [Phycisphaerae bacterium]